MEEEEVESKMRKIAKLIWFYILSLILFTGITGNFVYVHEKVHQTIYAKYDVNSSVHIMTGPLKFLSGTVAYTVTEDNSNCTDECVRLQIENEIYGYNVQYITMTIFLGIILIGSLIIILGMEDD